MVVEAQRADRLPHQRAEALALMHEPEPGTRLPRAGDEEVLGRGALGADEPPVPVNAELEAPPFLAELCPLAPVVLDDVERQLVLRRIGPRVEERHRVWVMDTGAGDLDELGKMLVAQRSQLERAAGHAQAEQWPGLSDVGHPASLSTAKGPLQRD